LPGNPSIFKIVHRGFKFCVFFLLVILPLKGICGEDPYKVSIWLGYENLIPLDKPSDFFSGQSSSQTTEIQNGNGIIGCVHYRFEPNIAPFIKTGYIWHKTLHTDTLIDSVNYSKAVYYRSIPFAIGLDYTILRIGNSFAIRLGFDVNYNIITRNSSVSYSDGSSTSTINNFGYSFNINPSLLFSNVRLECHLGYAKKGNYDFKYINILLPLYPVWFTRKK
jgi:hypothetical protein